MHTQANSAPDARNLTDILFKNLLPDDYQYPEQQFCRLLEAEDLDEQACARSGLVDDFERALADALAAAYGESGAGDDGAHLFIQRVLYRIYRLNLFWYDDLARYANEQSVYAHDVRKRIEAAWQAWEQSHLDGMELKLNAADVTQALIDRAQADLDPAFTADDYFFRDQLTTVGYRHLLAIASLDGLVEASQLSRILGGAANGIQARLTRLLLEEYGFGHLERKHSSYFIKMLDEAGMRAEPEAYLEIVPWEVLALTNQSFLFAERRRYFLRYIGGLLYFETSVPAAFRHYHAAATRLGISKNGRAYWDLHIHADERHGRWMLHDVALPLIEKYPQNAWEMVYGYDQQRAMSGRAGKAVVDAVREAQRPQSEALI